MKKLILKIIFPIFSGILLNLSFAPFRIDILAFISLIIFFYQINNSFKIYDIFFISILFGIAFFASSISWIYISIYLFTKSILISILLTIFLIIILNLLHIIPFSIFSYLITYKKNNFIKLLIYPSLWTLFEIIKANLLWGGFPWLSLGYSQTESILIWYAKIGGIYLVTYITTFIVSLITFYICNKNNYKTISITIFIIMIIYIIAIPIKNNQSKIQNKESQKIVLIQGNFIQNFKWNLNNLNKIKKYYKRIIPKFKNSLIIFSENAIPNYRQYMKIYFNDLKKLANKNNDAILIGSLSINKIRGAKSKIYNSAIIIGKGNGIYNKHHLVPFGEYFPIKFFGYINKIGLINFNAGNEVQPLMKAFNYSIANFICYEAAYPEQIRNQLQNADFISIISDDSWFGNSNQSEQQLEISQIRAIENNKYVLIASNNGITAIINPRGQIIKKLPKNISGLLEENIYINSYHTIWTKIGMSLIWLLLILTILIGLIIK